MTNLRQFTAILGATTMIVLVGPGCDGGGTAGSGGSAGSTSDGGGGTGGGTGGTAGTSMTGGGGAGTGGTATGGTGGSAPTDQGVRATDFVCAGGVAKSTNFKMVFSLGQSTQNQGRTKSTSYTMQGGLIGATGSLK